MLRLAQNILCYYHCTDNFEKDQHQCLESYADVNILQEEGEDRHRKNLVACHILDYMT